MPVQKNWKISEQTHKRVRILCAPDDMSQEELAKHALDAYEKFLLSRPVGTGKGNKLTLVDRPENVVKSTQALIEIRDIVLGAMSEESQVADHAGKRSGRVKAANRASQNAIEGVENPQGRKKKDSGGADQSGGVAS